MEIALNQQFQELTLAAGDAEEKQQALSQEKLVALQVLKASDQEEVRIQSLLWGKRSVFWREKLTPLLHNEVSQLNVPWNVKQLTLLREYFETKSLSFFRESHHGAFQSIDSLLELLSLGAEAHLHWNLNQMITYLYHSEQGEALKRFCRDVSGSGLSLILQVVPYSHLHGEEEYSLSLSITSEQGVGQLSELPPALFSCLGRLQIEDHLLDGELIECLSLMKRLRYLSIVMTKRQKREFLQNVYLPKSLETIAIRPHARAMSGIQDFLSQAPFPAPVTLKLNCGVRIGRSRSKQMLQAVMECCRQQSAHTIQELSLRGALEAHIGECREWFSNRAIWAGLSSLNLSHNPEASQQFRAIMLSGDLHTLNLSGCCQLSTSFIQKIPKRSPNLSTLLLQGCSQLDRHNLQALSKLNCLQHLNLNGCCLLTEKEIDRFVKKMPHLISLFWGGRNMV